MRCIGGRMALFYRYVHLLRCIITKVISVLLVQVILCLSLILPYEAYANSSSSVLTTSYLGRLQNGYYNFQFKLTNASTNLTKTVTKAVSPQSLYKVLRYVVSKRLAAFTTLASIAATTGIEYQDSETIYTPIPGSIADRNIGINTRDSGFVQVTNLNQACAVAYPELAFQWSQLNPVGYQNCRWNGTSYGSVTMDLCQDTIPSGCGWTRDLSLVLNPNPIQSQPKSIPDTVAIDLIIPQKPEEAPKLVDPTLVPSNILPTEVTEAIHELNNSLSQDDIYVPPYVPTAPTNGTATGGYGDGILNLDFPAFCSWAEPICKLSDWFMKDDIPENEQYQINEFDYSKLPNNPAFSFLQSCPAPLSIPLDFGIVSSSIEISYEPFCQFFAKARPFIIAAAYLHGAFIISGFRKET